MRTVFWYYGISEIFIIVCFKEQKENFKGKIFFCQKHNYKFHLKLLVKSIAKFLKYAIIKLEIRETLGQ